VQVTAPVTRRARTRIQLLAIGASTGGPNALSTVLEALPGDFPVPIVIVQHMPENFTAYLAKRLDEQCKITVGEPTDGQKLAAGSAWIAPGNLHMEVRGSPKAAEVKIRNGPLVNSCRPSVDVLFNSVVRSYAGATLAVVLTGMGQDGLRGCEALKEVGGQVIVQDQDTSVVWGMPGYVAGAGLADAVLPIDKVAGEVLRRVGRSPR
jgi:two-component system chemotaxis response regulator CheB